MIEKFILVSKNNVIRIFEILDGRKLNKDDLKERIVAGYLSLSLEHFSAILELIEMKMYSSAFTLLRPLLDAVYRAIWFNLVSLTDELKKFNNGSYEPKKTWELAKEIDKKEGDDTFHKVCERNLKFLNDMTHGGIHQITRQFSEDGRFVCATFSEDAIITLLNGAKGLISMILITYNNFQDDDLLKELGNEILRNKFTKN
ncbi:MAG: hypothetical protein R2837_08870 [Aliarcobacter sp.]